MSISQNKTKIVATLGPASFGTPMLIKLVKAGVNVFRINFSHADYSMLEDLVNRIRKVSADQKTPVSILGDLQGPKIRVGVVEGDGIALSDEEIIRITTVEQVSNHEKIFVNYKNLATEASPGDSLLIDDGKIQLEVSEKISNTELLAKVIHGGVLKSKKGVNLPNTPISIPSLTEKDLRDLEFVIQQQFDWVALSFVRSVNDILELKKIIRDHNIDLGIVAKIEKPAALKQLDAIIHESDAVMVARGDLGVEVPIEELPMVQRDIVERCRKAYTPVIIATQMMESMVTAFMPTRAEANDVANGVLEGADALMLSGETSVGNHPELVVDYMNKIIRRVEELGDIFHAPTQIESKNNPVYLSDILCQNAVQTAKNLNAKALITMTQSGYTALRVTSFRPKAPVYCFTNNERLLNRLPLVWGLTGYLYDKMNSTDECIEDSIEILKANKHLKKGDLVINLASMPIQRKLRTNTIKITEVE